MRFGVVPTLLAWPIALSLLLTTPIVQRHFLPPPQTVVSLTATARARPPAPPPVQRDVVYHQDLLRRYRLDVYGPRQESLDAGDTTAPLGPTVGSAAPAIVFYHGGSWLRGDKITIMIIDRFLARMRQEGWFVISVNYTTSALRGIGGAVDTAAEAYRWAVEQAPTYGWDPTRIGLYGVSAGGHVALMTAARAAGPAGRPGDTGATALPVPAFVLAECAPVDLIAMRAGDAFENASTFRLFPRRRLRALSPARHINEAFPPTLIYHGDADQTVAYRQAEILAEALSDAAVPHTLVRYPGGNHAFLNYDDDQWYEQETRAIRWMGSVFSTGAPPRQPLPPPAEMELYGAGR